MNDFNIKITVRNARLLNAIRAAYGSPAAMCRVAGLNRQHLSALVTMRALPFRIDGSLTSIAEAVVSALGIPADELWPAHIAKLKARRAQVEIEMDAPSFAAIAHGGDPEKRIIHRQAIAKWSGGLTDREKIALAIHHSDGTFDDVGKAIGGISREGSRKIVLRAERKIREAATRDGVRQWSDIA
jgi:hypothetical protein